MEKSSNSVQISVITPVYNETYTLEPLIDQLQIVLRSLRFKWEIVVVDDGSNSETKENLSLICSKHKNVKLVSFIRNFGQHAAIEAGLRQSTGDIVIVMDSDLQDSPYHIPLLIEPLELGFDIVYAKRSSEEIPLHYRLLRRIFYRLLVHLSGLKLNSTVGNYCAFNKRAKTSLLSLNGAIPFFPAALQWLQLKEFFIDVERKSRHESDLRPKYTLKSRYNLALTAISTISTRLLKLSLIAGIGAYLCALFTAIIVVFFAQIRGTAVSGWSSIIILTLILSGTQLLSLGIIGIYLSHISEKVRFLPRYIVDDHLNDDDK